jgi:hypothetical protein
MPFNSLKATLAPKPHLDDTAAIDGVQFREVFREILLNSENYQEHRDVIALDTPVDHFKSGIMASRHQVCSQIPSWSLIPFA